MSEISNKKKIREMDADELEEKYKEYWMLPFATYDEMREMEMMAEQYKQLTGKEISHDQG